MSHRNFRFETCERILRTRISLLDAFRRSEKLQQITEEPSAAYAAASVMQQDYLLDLSRRARSSGRLQIALNAVLRAKRLSDSDDQQCGYDVKYELAKVIWDKGEHVTAIDALQRMAVEANQSRLNLQPVERASILSQLVRVSATPAIY